MSPSKDSPSTGTSSKIAIKGFSLSSKSSPAVPNSKHKVAPKSTLGKRARSTFARDESDSEDDGKQRHEIVTGFGENGAVNEEAERKRREREPGPLVIERLANRDWKAEARRRAGRDLLPAEERARREGRAVSGMEVEGGKQQEEEEEEEVKWGLSVRKRESSAEAAKKLVEDPIQDNVDERAAVAAQTSEVKTEPQMEKTVDELAVDALMGITSKPNRPDLVITSEATVSTLPSGPMDEESAYRLAVASAPDVSTLEDYERVPVEDFGAALLRGMGWDGKERKSGRKEVQRRQNLLGLGAKELKGAEELGAWVQKSDVKRLKPGGGGANGGGNRGGANGGSGKKGLGDYRREREERERRRRGDDDERDAKEERHRDRRREDRRGERDEYRRRDRDEHYQKEDRYRDSGHRDRRR